MQRSFCCPGDVEKVKKYQPIDCTTNPSLVLKAVQMPEYEHYLQDAINEEKSANASDKYIDENRPFAGALPCCCAALALLRADQGQRSHL